MKYGHAFTSFTNAPLFTLKTGDLLESINLWIGISLPLQTMMPSEKAPEFHSLARSSARLVSSVINTHSLVKILFGDFTPHFISL